jgi:hypothetical protein
MSLRQFAPLFVLFFAACAAFHQNQAPSEKEFEVPTDLANKFAVQENSPVPVHAEKTPESTEATVSVKTKGKQLAAKTSPKKKEKKAESYVNRWTMKPFFQEGERYLFDVTYFGATAGEFELSILPQKVIAGRQSYHFRGQARSSSVFSLFYSVNDVAESFMDAEGLFSHKFSLKIDESKQQRDLLELYDQRAHKVYYWSKLDHKTKGKRLDQFEIPIDPYAQDGLSAFFYVRALPLELGQAYEFPLVTNGKMRNVRVTVLRKEKLTTRLGEFDAIVLKPEVVLDGVLKNTGDSFLWVSDDERRILLKIDAKIKVGSVIGYLREHGYGGTPSAKR